jgi:hypothetical protein
MYSKIISIKYEPKGLIRRVINPVQQSMFINLTSYTSGTFNEWRLYDIQGKIVHREQFSSQTIYGSIPAIATGIYILEVRMGDKTERIKISKVN